MTENRGYSREALERRRSPKRRKIRRCACGVKLPPWRYGSCLDHDTNGPGLEGEDEGEDDPFAGCICNLGAKDFPNGRSVCGLPCRVHAPRKVSA